MKNYGLIDREVMRSRNISIKAKGLYAYLCSMAGSKGVCYPSRRTTCHYLRICDSTLTTLTDELIKEGVIRCELKRSKKGTFEKKTYVINSVQTMHGSDLHGRAVHGDTVTDMEGTNNINK